MAEVSLHVVDDSNSQEHGNFTPKSTSSVSSSKRNVRDLDKRLSDMEAKFDSNIEKILQSLETVKNAHLSGCSDSQNSENKQSTVGSAQLRAVSGDTDSVSRPRQLISLNYGIDNDIASMNQQGRQLVMSEIGSEQKVVFYLAYRGSNHVIIKMASRGRYFSPFYIL
ncbi:hypothetical protein DPMN_109416 [Dreissena polymorpha]|uniref:Uncharacterized protein n=1 Tax=Dreissena polymorpha TaxID=45954 RepID=A0A9D4KA84_DREPO|nr:hypothetical protein DPMN_109416 [Dreissena polymorpha]